MLRFLLMLTSFANTAGGLVLIATWAAMWPRVPFIVLLIGGSLLIQGGYAILYLHGDFDFWRDLATGALFAGEVLALCVGGAMFVQGILHNLSTADIEMAPVLAGILMLAQAAIALVWLHASDRLRPGRRWRTPA